MGDRALVVGWFSWPAHQATAGDLLARDVACEWLDLTGRPYDIANAPGFGRGVDWRWADPDRYSDLVFVCGPIGPFSALADMLERFAGSRRVGLGVTMLEPTEEWNPFHVLLERDSLKGARPDLAFVSHGERVPVVGVVLVESYEPEYPGRDRQDAARAAVEAVVASQHAARVPIDTRLDFNETGLRTPSEVEALIARMDVVVTTRLHGLVLALKNGVPALAVDPVAGGSKICRQAEVIGWPVVRAADKLDAVDLAKAFEYCLTPEARGLARACAARATALLDDVRVEFINAMSPSSP